MFTVWPRGPLGLIVGWTAAAVMAVAFAIVYVTLMGLYVAWVILLAIYRTFRRQ